MVSPQSFREDGEAHSKELRHSMNIEEPECFHVTETQQGMGQRARS